MTNANDVRRAHDVLDGLFAGRVLSRENEQLLRSFLPELPKQKTLEKICEYVDDAWFKADDPESKEWLHELHAQLQGLEVAATIAPALPAGMRIAEHENFGHCVVAPTTDRDGERKIFYLDASATDGANYCWVPVNSLAFIDAEPAKPTHPEFLDTEADYENAPDGTVVAVSDRVPWVKVENGDWICGYGTNSDLAMALDGRRQVLRWGWGK